MGGHHIMTEHLQHDLKGFRDIGIVVSDENAPVLDLHGDEHRPPQISDGLPAPASNGEREAGQ